MNVVSGHDYALPLLHLQLPVTTWANEINFIINHGPEILTKIKSVSDLLPASQGYQKTSDFMLQVFSVLMEYVKKNNDRGTKILDFHHPDTLKEMMGHCLDIQEDPQNLEQILSDCKETLKYCVKTGEY